MPNLAMKTGPLERSEARSEEIERPEQPLFEIIELFFFAYRDFVSDPDRVLDQYAFGRAHHRVLHFVNRQPGLTIAELLDILKITKQSLNRVLKELIDQGYIEQRPGVADRRQRLLFATQPGRALALEMARMQSRRIEEALKGFDPADHAVVARFLMAMIDGPEREKVQKLVAGVSITSVKAPE